MKTILVCQGRSCRKDGSHQVLEAFHSLAIAGIKILPTGCLGKCGNGPTILILPEKIWHQRVKPQDVTENKFLLLSDL